MQTFNPDHYSLQFAADHDVNGFYARELEYRRKLGYPPFAKLVRLEYRNVNNDKAKEEAVKMADKLKVKLEAEGFRQTEMVGPVPCFFAKENGEHRWQIVLRGPDPTAVLKGARFNEWRIEADPIDLL